MHDLEAEETALLEKETLRAKEAQEAEATKFQTRASRNSPSEGASISKGGTPQTGAEEGEHRASRPGWTFRKTENLRVWAAALKLRYAIQTTATRAAVRPVAAAPTYGNLGLGKLNLHGRRVASESHISSDISKSSSRTIDFDPVRVARHDAGWQEMLTKLIHAWIDAVAAEQSPM
uniref:Uncharacterized protein n=2 Tax=Kalmanozyma brasiliensis (strain GHG001) TaxID=1365824 RepID=V5E7P9_KALBG